MSQRTTVYDLGIVEPPPPPVTSMPLPVPSVVDRREPALAGPTANLDPPRTPADAIADSLGLAIPGMSQMLRGRWADGLFFLTGSLFLLTLGWAVLNSLERLPSTLVALGYPSFGGIYALELIFLALAWTHVGNILFGTPRGVHRTHPVVAGIASACVPGWGQILNQQPRKAAAFLAGLWTVAFVWLLSSSWALGIFAAHGVELESSLRVLSSPVVLWTAPILLWALAIYDAVATAKTE
ncbi:MAG: hypothetical protein OEV00_01080 [Acidobacteriota bacterium]|nr:hypothetical protein [Acidobacteriota bacterium]MDH3783898.1 hypothetical protein [Acidobacteriota bacterium]